MRASSDYRAHQRNQAREWGLLSLRARVDEPWRTANGKAKLPERRKVCAAARAAVVEAAARGALAGMGKRAVVTVLRDFWKEQPDSRVRSRILRELAA